MIASTNAVAKFAAIVAGLGLVAMSFASFAPAAKAMTADEIAAQIAALQAQLAALTGSSSASVTFTTDLTIGSTGSQVTALQNWLISEGYQIPAGATGYFGTQTQAAVASYQTNKGIAPAVGYFGPITRAAINSQGGASTGGTTGGSSDLSGGAGSVDSYTLLSSLNNEEVGEDEEDVEVAGLEIEADDGSDLELTAVRLVFDEGTAGSDFEDYATEVSLWLDGEEVGRVDADEFNDDNSWTKTVSLDNGAIIKAGDTSELVVAVSGIGNLDSSDAADTWTVDFRQIRFMDADGATISEDPLTGTRTFSFELFATATNAELKIASDDDDVNDPRTIQVDATADTDNVPVLSFTLEADGDSDLELKTAAVSVTVTGASNTDDVISSLSLWIDNDEIATADTVSGAGSVEDYFFDDVDYTIDAGDTVSAEVRADFQSIADALDEGDTIAFSVSEDLTDQNSLWDIEDETGENLADSDITGSVTSGAFELRSIGIQVTFVSASESVTANDSADDDVGTFKIKYNVKAFGADVWVSNDASPTIATTIPDSTIATNGVRYLLDEAGTPTVSLVTDFVDFDTTSGVTDGTNGVQINEDKDTDFELTVVRTNDTGPDGDGIYRVLLKAIGWATSDTTTFNVYDFNLDDFKTSTVNLN